MSPLRQRMLEDLRLRGLAPHTAYLYLRAVADLPVTSANPPISSVLNTFVLISSICSTNRCRTPR
jgi:hypothetical protein